MVQHDGKGHWANFFFFLQDTLDYKKTTSSRLRKQSSRDKDIGLSSNENKKNNNNKRLRKIELVQENVYKSAKSLAVPIETKMFL